MNKELNEVLLIMQENEKLKKKNSLLSQFKDCVIGEIKQCYSRQRIISNLVSEAKKRKLL